jgi:hypothetical protein
MFDVDGSGTLDYGELKLMLRQMQVRPSQSVTVMRVLLD